MKAVRLDEIYQTYKNDIEFFFIYISEAHAANGWQTPQNLYEDIIFDEPTNDDERAEVAHACQVGLGIKMPALIDGIDNDADNKYIAKPVRLYVIDKNGILTFNGAPGPREYDTETWAAAIEAEVAKG